MPFLTLTDSFPYQKARVLQAAPRIVKFGMLIELDTLIKSEIKKQKLSLL